LQLGSIFFQAIAMVGAVYLSTRVWQKDATKPVDCTRSENAARDVSLFFVTSWAPESK
jgi:hypothetical protein